MAANVQVTGYSASDSRPLRIMKNFLLLLAGLAGVLAAPPKDGPVKIPTHVKLCTRGLPNLNECLRDAVQDIFPKLRDGMKELDLPALDPLIVEESSYEATTPLFSGKTVVKDAHVYGLSQAKFSRFRANFDDPNDITLEADMHLPTARVQGMFKYNGNVMNIPLRGKGPFNITGEDIDINWKITGLLTGVNGEKYLKVKSYIITPKFGDMKIEARNLIDGNPVLSRQLVAMVNQYWKIGVEIGLPYTQEGWDKAFRSVANRVFQRIPFDMLFPSA